MPCGARVVESLCLKTQHSKRLPERLIAGDFHYVFCPILMIYLAVLHASKAPSPAPDHPRSGESTVLARRLVDYGALTCPPPSLMNEIEPVPNQARMKAWAGATPVLGGRVRPNPRASSRLRGSLPPTPEPVHFPKEHSNETLHTETTEAKPRAH